MQTRILLALILLLSAGCGSPETRIALQTVDHVDLQRYQGLWYEVARLPNWFQRDCIRSTARYELMPDGRVKVINRCQNERGDCEAAIGYATVTDPQTNARLEVLFDNWFSNLFPFLAKGQYWVLDLDPAYRRVIVGTPDRDYLWFLARTPTIAEEEYLQMLETSRRLGFDVGRIVRPPDR